MTKVNPTVQRIRTNAVKNKASMLLGYKKAKISLVIEDYNGAHVELKNGNAIRIPYEVWVLGWTEEQYIEFQKTV